MSPEEQHVRAVLTEAFGDCIDENDGLINQRGEYIWWNSAYDLDTVVVDGSFTAIQLAAIAWWMMHKEKKHGSSNAPTGGAHQA